MNYTEPLAQIFLVMDRIPSTTSQEKGVQVVGGRPHFYTKKSVQDVKDFYAACLRSKGPPEPFEGALELRVNFYYPVKKPHKQGEPKTTRPDTDNMIKALKDVMTDLGFWKDDAQIVVEHVTKSYSDPSGVQIKIIRITEDLWRK